MTALEKLRAMAHSGLLPAKQELTLEDFRELLAHVERLENVLGILLEEATDMRLYCKDWDWKYGEGWDSALEDARKALGEKDG
jgi:hypothetical protein